MMSQWVRFLFIYLEVVTNKVYFLARDSQLTVQTYWKRKLNTFNSTYQKTTISWNAFNTHNFNFGHTTSKQQVFNQPSSWSPITLMYADTRTWRIPRRTSAGLSTLDWCLGSWWGRPGLNTALLQASARIGSCQKSSRLLSKMPSRRTQRLSLILASCPVDKEMMCH